MCVVQGGYIATRRTDGRTGGRARVYVWVWACVFRRWLTCSPCGLWNRRIGGASYLTCWMGLGLFVVRTKREVESIYGSWSYELLEILRAGIDRT